MIARHGLLLALALFSTSCVGMVDHSIRSAGPFCLSSTAPVEHPSSPGTLTPGEYELTQISPGEREGPDTTRGRMALRREGDESLQGEYTVEGSDNTQMPVLVRKDLLLLGPCGVTLDCIDVGTLEYRITDSTQRGAWGRWRLEYGIAHPIDRSGRAIRSISGPFCLRRIAPA
jgi:hypothetical protein